MSFRKDQEKMLTKEYRSLCQNPAKLFSFKTKIWSPKHWIITQECQGESTIIPTEIVPNTDDTMSYIPHHKRSTLRDQEKGLNSSNIFSEESVNVTYTLSKYTQRTNDSGYLGWRWLNFFYRTNSCFWNLLFFLGIGINNRVTLNINTHRIKISSYNFNIENIRYFTTIQKYNINLLLSAQSSF